MSPPERTYDIHAFFDDDLWAHGRIQIHAGETQIWKRAGVVPPGHNDLLGAAQMADPHAKLWHGDWDDRGTERGIKVLGTPLGHRADFEAQLQRTADDHQQLLDRIPLVRDLQSAWLLFVLRVNARELLPSRGPPFCFESFARLHDTRIWQCFSAFLGQLSHRPTWEVEGLPLCMRSLGLQNALRTAHAAHSASWADCLPVIKERRGFVVRTMVAALNDPPKDAVHNWRWVRDT